MFELTKQTERGLPDRLYFLHIPKTAGTSLRFWLNDLFEQHAWLRCHIVDELLRYSPEQIRQHRLLSGHFGWRALEYSGEERPTVTWLRDPVRREISNYDYNLNAHEELEHIAQENNRDDWLEFYKASRDLSLPELCQSNLYRGYCDNLQTRYLSGLFPNDAHSIVDERALEIAKTNLRRMLFFGLCEWMDCSIDLCCWYFTIPYRPMTSRYNQSKEYGQSTTTQLTDAEAAVVRHVNHFDQRLYEYGVELLRSRYVDFLRTVGIFAKNTETVSEIASIAADPRYRPRIVQAIENEAHRRNHPVAYPDRGCVRFSDAVIHSGWHSRVVLSNGTCVRWAGSQSSAAVYLPLRSDRSYRISIQIYYAVSYEVLRTLAVQLNQIKIPLQIEPVHDEPSSPSAKYRATALVPASAIDGLYPYSRLEITTEGELVPLSTNPDCLVSFATDGIEYEAVEEMAGSATAAA